MDPTDNPFAARTPADFWRRWNRPIMQFLREYVFRPAGGPRHPVRATLATFAVSGLIHEYVFAISSGRFQGWQMVFFMLQGCATLATLNARPRGWMAPLCIAGTLAFNLGTSILFFQSVNEVVPFYSPRAM